MRESRLHTGWTVLAAGAVGVFMTTPGQTVGVSAFVDHIAADLSLAREHVLMLYSVGTLLGILPAPLIGRVVDRYGPRRAIAVIVVALGAACAMVGAAHGPWSLAIGFTLLRGSAIGGLSLVSVTMVNLWFDRLRGRATSIAMMGLAGGGLVVPGLAEHITTGYGWRTAYLALGAGVVVIMLPVGVMFFRNRPQSYGMKPDFGKTPAAQASQGNADMTLGEAARTRMFWYLLAIAILVNAVGTALLLDHARALQSAGLSRTAVIALLGLVTVTQAFSMLGGGVLIDRFGSRRVGMLGLMLLGLTVACLMTARHLAAGLAYAAGLGAMLGVLTVVSGAGLAEHFGTRHLGTIRGTTFVVGVVGAATGPLPFVWSPEAAYWIYLACAAAALALGAVSAPHALRRRIIRA